MTGGAAELAESTHAANDTIAETHREASGRRPRHVSVFCARLQLGQPTHSCACERGGFGMNLGSFNRATRYGAVMAVAGVAAACGGGGTSSPSSSGGASVPAGLGVKSFDSSFSVMSSLKGLTTAGKGLVGVILPDTTSSTRYVNYDAPYLTRAFAAAGYTTSDFKIDNAQGSDATELADAQADVTLGASVLVF